MILFLGIVGLLIFTYKNVKKTPIENLDLIPQDVLRYHLLPFLDKKSIYALSQTCKEYRDTYSDDYFVQLIQNMFGYIVNRYELKYIAKSAIFALLILRRKDISLIRAVITDYIDVYNRKRFWRF